MANIWDINVMPTDGIKYLEMLMANVTLARESTYTVHVQDNSISQHAFLSSDETDFFQVNSSISSHDEQDLRDEFVKCGRKSRRGAFGNIWDFEVYSTV